MKCAVTGATGFIGAELLRQLTARGVETVTASRTLIPAEQLGGVHTLFHCAGIAHRRASVAAQEQANCAAVLTQARAAQSAGIRQFVFLSSAKAAPDGDAYGRAKWRAEEGLAALAAAPDTATPAAGGLSVVVLRPALVYGPGVTANLRSLLRAVRAGMPAPPPLGERSLVAVEDLCAVMGRLLEAPPGGYCCFYVTDGERYHLQRIYGAFRRALGREPGRSLIPAPLWRAACTLYDWAFVSCWRGGGGTRRSESTWQTLCAKEVYSNRDVCRALGWRPTQTLEDAAAAMVAEMSG